MSSSVFTPIDSRRITSLLISMKVNVAKLHDTPMPKKTQNIIISYSHHNLKMNLQNSLNPWIQCCFSRLSRKDMYVFLIYSLSSTCTVCVREEDGSVPAEAGPSLQHGCPLSSASRKPIKRMDRGDQRQRDWIHFPARHLGKIGFIFSSTLSPLLSSHTREKR